MIRVLHVLGGLNRGGDETMVMNLYRKIDRSQIQFDFVIHTTEHQAYYDEIISLGGTIYSFPAFNGKNYFTLRKLWNNIFKEHPEYKILHSHIRSYASLYLPIAKKNGVKTIVHSHSTSNGKGLSSFVKMILQLPLRYQADYLFACSKNAGEWLFGKKACTKNNFYVIPNAIDTERFAFNQEIRDQYREEMHLQDKFVIGHVGRFMEAKNHMFLLEVFKEVLAKKSNAVLMLVGDGELRPLIEQKIKDLGIKDYVLLLGSRSDVPELMQAMDIFTFPSIWEGLGMVAVEAQCSGLPCICGCNIPDLIKLSSYCIFVDYEKDKWVEKILNCPITKRFDGEKIVQGAGFDINGSVEKISDFYIRLYQCRK